MPAHIGIPRPATISILISTRLDSTRNIAGFITN
jgi:hypothetical protein